MTIKRNVPPNKISSKRLASLGGKLPYSSVAKRSGSGSGVVKRRKPRALTPKQQRVRAEIRATRRAKAAEDFARKYHSVERVEFVKSLPCFASGIRGNIENAHVSDPTRTKGMGRKASYLGIVPLSVECHRLLHRNPARFTERFGEFDWDAAAAWTEAEWQKHAAREGVE